MKRNQIVGSIIDGGLIEPKSAVVIGLSGGPDSLCLLHALSSIADMFDLILVPVHINHMLRPEAESEADRTERMGIMRNPTAFWALLIVLTREFAVTGLRLIAVGNGRVIAAGMSGKIKTFATMVGLCFMIVFYQWKWLDRIVIAVIVVTTLYSGVEYFVQNWDVLNLKKKD